MDREAWQANPWGRKRFRHDLATKQQEIKRFYMNQPELQWDVS